ncbi:hypothetical protein V8E54_010502 [Elaphomyces granulatus]
MELKTMVFLLKNMKIKEEHRRALEKAFEFVCGFGISNFDPESNFVMTSTGLSKIEGGSALNVLFEGPMDESIGSWD